MHSRMSDGTHLTTWVSQQTKRQFAALARQRDVSESALLKHLIELTLQTASTGLQPTSTADAAKRATRLSIRLRPDDQLLLRERARARGVPAATYVSVLL